MTAVAEKKLQKKWQAIEPVLRVRTESEYDRATEVLNQLIDAVGLNENHPLYDLLDTLGTLVHAYEAEHHSVPVCSGIEALHYLMKEHDLSQSDLSDVGSQGVISELLSGKRELNLRQIRALSARFHVPPAVFI